jgi:hypothetical protein
MQGGFHFWFPIGFGHGRPGKADMEFRCLTRLVSLIDDRKFKRTQKHIFDKQQNG